MEVRISLRNVDPKRFRLPPFLARKVEDAMRKRSLGVGMDYDRTMVNTDEPNRIFPPFKGDESRVIEPAGGLLILGMPVAILSGNKPSYLDSLCVRGFREHLREKGKVSVMQKLSVYSQNSTWLQVFDSNGEPLEEMGKGYVEQYRIPEKHIAKIREAFLVPLHEAMSKRFMHETPMVIRPEGTHEAHYAYGPIFENRGGVQLSWIAVPGDLREGVIAAAVKQLDEDIRRTYSFEPGGQFSIDINHRGVAKNNGTAHFRRGNGLSLLLYFGDSVYRKGKHVGNDLPVVNDKSAIVFAVNPNQDEVPQHERIVRAGVGPDATRAWLSWLLATSVKVRFDSEHLSDTEKKRMVDALLESGLEDKILIA